MHHEARPGYAASMPTVDQIIDGKYRLLRLLGEGGMAFVFEASHVKLGQRVAIKVLAPEFSRDPELVARFEREARAVVRLRTPHAVRVTDVDVSPEGWPYMVMEFLEGRDLDAELQARDKLPVDEAVDYVLQACAAMIEAHAIGIIHRDLKPANLFLAQDADTRTIKVLDFGISKVLGEATRLTSAGAVMGTVLYMSPEQVRASSNVDPRADIWSLGVILYELVAGRAPFDGTSPQIAAAIVSRDAPDIRSFVSVPDAFAAVVMKTLARDPASRFANMKELAVQLAPFARPGTQGATFAAQLSLSTSAVRTPALLGPMAPQNKTVPMILPGGRSAMGSVVPHARASAPPPASRDREDQPTPPPRSARDADAARAAQRGGHASLALGLLIGFLAACVVVGVGYYRYGRFFRAPPAAAGAPRSSK